MLILRIVCPEIWRVVHFNGDRDPSMEKLADFIALEVVRHDGIERRTTSEAYVLGLHEVDELKFSIMLVP